MDKMKNYLIFFSLVVGCLLQGCISDYSYDLGNGYVYCDEGEDLKFIYHKQSIGGEIPPTILSYKLDDNFIIVKQKPRLTEIHDSIFYFIIVKNDKEIHGPFNREQYLKEKLKRGISLMFDD